MEYLNYKERAELNAKNRATYAASEAKKLADAAAKTAARRTTLTDEQRYARMMETSCGTVEDSGNPRKNCLCDTCVRRRAVKTASHKLRRQAKTVDLKPNMPDHRAERFTKYGLTEVAYHRLLEKQDYKCAICGTSSPDSKDSHADWRVDHDHLCCPAGQACKACIRGLLCNSCNWGLDNFKDSVTIMAFAIAYLRNADSRQIL